MRRFTDRRAAGRQLGDRLRDVLDDEALVVLGLPRGGVPVAAEVASALHAPLDVLVVRKVGAPSSPELAVGAVGEDGAEVLEEEVISSTGTTWPDLDAGLRRERGEVARRTRALRSSVPAVPLEGRTAVVVDDGVATGATARAACRLARARGAAGVVLAVPTCSPAAVPALQAEVDLLVALEEPALAQSVSQAYDDFRPVDDARVLELLLRSRASWPGAHEEDVVVDAGPEALRGRFAVPHGPGRARGVVVFAHGAGSDEHSPRNRRVAAVVQEAGLATLLVGLGEDPSPMPVAVRLARAVAWVREHRDCRALPVGLFASSSGAAGALLLAARPSEAVRAVVCRGGRPDLVESVLPQVRAPVLLVVGGHDPAVLALNEVAAARLRCEHRLEVVPGASHLFAEPGTLDAVARLSRDWFLRHLRPVSEADEEVRR